MKRIGVKGLKINAHAHRNEGGLQGEEEAEDQVHSRTSPHQTQHRQDQLHELRGVSPTAAEFMVGIETLDLSDQSRPRTRSSERCPHNIASGSDEQENVSYHHHNHRKREKMGLFRNLRRRLSSLRKSEGAECNGHIEECQSPNLTPNLASTRLKEKNRSKLSRDKSSCSSSPVSNSSLQNYMSPKFNEWHSNTDHRDSEAIKDKPGCVSKDISCFNVESTRCNSVNIVCDGTNSGRAGLTSCVIKKENKTYNSASTHELTECVECDSAKEQTKILSPKWSLTQELFRLSKFGWYWGPITRNEAEDKLTNQPDGAFLVRDSSDERYLLSLSFRSYGRTLHTRIEHCNGMFSFYAQPDTEGYPSIVDLIEHSMNDSQSGILYYSRSHSPGAPQFPSRLTKPVSRFLHVRSLQYLCRFVIRQYTRYDHIQQLPLPTTLKGWIEETQY